MRKVSQRKQPVTGCIRTGATAVPITQIGSSSGAATTTYAARNNGVFRVTDAAPWDLSAVAVGYIAKTADGFRGRIVAVSNVGNYIEVDKWLTEGQSDARAANRPADGGACAIHRLDYCKRMEIRAASANNNPFFIGFDTNVEPGTWLNNSGIEVSNTLTHPTSELVITAEIAEFLDATEIYGINAGSAEYALWVAM